MRFGVNVVRRSIPLLEQAQQSSGVVVYKDVPKMMTGKPLKSAVFVLILMTGRHENDDWNSRFRPDFDDVASRF